MKKLLLVLLALLLVACGAEETQENEPIEEEETEEVAAESEQEEPEEVEEIEEEPAEEDNTIDETLEFGEFTVNMEEVNVYEEDGKTLADVSFSWLNQSGEESTFMAISLLDAKQGDELLEEVTGAWDIMNKNSSDVYFPNANGGEKKIELTYELVNEDDPITLIFAPLNDVVDEDSQEVNIDIN